MSCLEDALQGTSPQGSELALPGCDATAAFPSVPAAFCACGRDPPVPWR